MKASVTVQLDPGVKTSELQRFIRLRLYQPLAIYRLRHKLEKIPTRDFDPPPPPPPELRKPPKGVT